MLKEQINTNLNNLVKIRINKLINSNHSNTYKDLYFKIKQDIKFYLFGSFCYYSILLIMNKNIKTNLIKKLTDNIYLSIYFKISFYVLLYTLPVIVTYNEITNKLIFTK